MTVYQRDIEAALARFANEFDDLSTVERRNIIDFNAINPLSARREVWNLATNTPSEHKLSTSAGVDETAWLETVERGQYVAGFEVQLGTGVRIPTRPSNNEEMRWGYFTADANQQPVNGFYFGVDSDGIFVAYARAGTETKIYQDSWNIDTLDGSDVEQKNPSGGTLDLSTGQIFQIEFTYYGYGPVQFSVLVDGLEAKESEDSRAVIVHEQRFDGQTSLENTNLPLRQQVDNVDTNADVLDMFVGGRQFSIVGNPTSNNRTNAHYRDSRTGIDDTQWYPAVSIKLKDGSDIGSIDFKHVLAEVFDFEVSNDTVEKRWMIRRNTVLDQTTWQDPSSVEGNTDETALKVDTTATTWLDGGSVSGHYLDSGVLPSGDNQVRNVTKDSTTGSITDEEILTLAFRAQPGAGTGEITALNFKWEEKW